MYSESQKNCKLLAGYLCDNGHGKVVFLGYNLAII
jgi:hypothetical protein